MDLEDLMNSFFNEDTTDIDNEMNEYSNTYTYRDNDDIIVYYRPVKPAEYINITFEINKENKLPEHLFRIDE